MTLRVAMRRSFVEDHHRRWPPNFQADLLSAGVKYTVMCASALQHLLSSEARERWLDEPGGIKTADLVASVVEMLASIIDPRGTFAASFQEQIIPVNAPEHVHELVALARDEERPSWSKLIALKFDSLDGWALICQVCALSCRFAAHTPLRQPFCPRRGCRACAANVWHSTPEQRPEL